MVDVRTEILIDCPVEQVAAYAANPDHAPEWYSNIHTAIWKTPKPLETGSQIDFEADFLGRKLSYVYEIAAYVPGEKMVMRTANGPFPMETTYTWAAVEGGKTRMALRNKGVPTGFSKLVSPFMAMMMRKENRKDLKKIKEILER